MMLGEFNTGLNTYFSFFCTDNTAVGHQAWASSNFPYDPGYPCPIGSQPGYAVDGNRAYAYLHCSCWVTVNVDANPWWAVDIGSKIRVYGVNVTSRDDGNGQRSNKVI